MQLEFREEFTLNWVVIKCVLWEVRFGWALKATEGFKTIILKEILAPGKTINQIEGQKGKENPWGSLS